MATAKTPSLPPSPTPQNRQMRLGAARKEGHAFRGMLIDHFAHLERSLGPVLVLASTLPAYASAVKKPAHLLGQKIEQLRRIAGMEGPFQKGADGLLASLEALRRHEEFRHFMAHATLEIMQGEDGDLIYLFRLARAGKAGVEHSSVAISKAEARSIGSELGALVEGLTRQLNALSRLPGRKIAKREISPGVLPV